MRTLFVLLLWFTVASLAWTQSVPQGIPYQAVLRNPYGVPMGDRDLDLRVRILDPESRHVYLEEVHHVTVAPEGTFGLVIGEGRALVGDFGSIPWSVGRMWIDIAYDLDGQGRFESSGAMQLLSVPYAMHAATASALAADPGLPAGEDAQPAAGTRGSNLQDLVWRTNGNALTPVPFPIDNPQQVIGDPDIIPEFLGSTNDLPLMFRTSDSLRAFIMPNGSLHILKDQTNYSGLTVSGDVLFKQNLVVKGHAEFGVADFFNLHVFNNVVVDNHLAVAHDVQFGEDLDVAGNTHIGGDLAVDANGDFGGAVTVGTDLSVGHDATIGNDLAAGGDAVIGASATIGTNLNVGQNGAFGNDLTVGHDATIGNDLAAGGDANVSGSASVGTDLTVGHDATVGNDISAGGDAVIGASATIGTNLSVGQNGALGNDLTVGHDATIGNDLSLGGDMSVAGSTTIATDLTVGHDATIGNDISVGADAVIGATAVVGTNLTVGQNSSIGGSETVGNDLTVGDALSVGGAASVGGHLAVGSGATITGNTSVTGTLSTTGNISSGGNISATGDLSAGDDLFVTDAASIGGHMTVGSGAAITGTLSVTGNISSSANISASGDLSAGDDLTVTDDARIMGNCATNGVLYVGAGTAPYANVGLTIRKDDTYNTRSELADGTFLSYLRNDGQMFVSHKNGGSQGTTGSYTLLLENPDQGMFIRINKENLTDANNFIIFTQLNSGGGTVVAGRIESNGSGGVTYGSGGADYAEYLLRDEDEPAMAYGDIVGVHDGVISHRTHGASRMMVVTNRPVVLGNMPGQDEGDYEKVAFLGQLPVRVRGKVNAGDYILPSGQEDGTGIACAPERMRTADYSRIVGVAWEDSTEPGIKEIHTAVGLNQNDLVRVAMTQEEQIRSLQTAQQDLQRKMDTLMEKMDRMEAGTNGL